MKPKRKPQIPTNPFERQLIIEGQPLEGMRDILGQVRTKMLEDGRDKWN